MPAQNQCLCSLGLAAQGQETTMAKKAKTKLKKGKKIRKVQTLRTAYK
jgi:hypothetical protein